MIEGDAVSAVVYNAATSSRKIVTKDDHGMPRQVLFVYYRTGCRFQVLYESWLQCC